MKRVDRWWKRAGVVLLAVAALLVATGMRSSSGPDQALRAPATGGNGNSAVEAMAHLGGYVEDKHLPESQVSVEDDLTRYGQLRNLEARDPAALAVNDIRCPGTEPCGP
jgi:hypothetical protein